MTLSSFSKTTVRLVLSVSAIIVLDSLVVALAKLNHVIAGLYMCVHHPWQENAY
jgi:hypothetical protein